MIKRTSRDNARTPMQWSGDEGAGFTSGKPWLKINKNHTWVNVEWEHARDGGVLEFWQRMIAKRKSIPALVDGSFRVICESGAIYAFERKCENSHYISISNMTNRRVRIPKKLRSGKVEISSYKSASKDELLPFEFRLVRCSDAKK